MIDRDAFKENILIQIPFLFGYIAGRSESIVMSIPMILISTLIVIVIKRNERN